MVNKPTQAQQAERETAVLAALYVKPGRTGEIAQRVGLSYGQVYNITRYLASRGLVSQHPLMGWQVNR